jgi:thymidylate synthase
MPLTATGAWLLTLSDLLKHGLHVAPRGQATTEILQHTMVVDMRYPVVLLPERKLSEKFLGAEAHWILSGDDRVETIAPYNTRIAEFSDDGLTFFGAYGPRLVEQLDYVVEKLKSDKDTRQAGLTLWRPNPPQTKDVPCTVAMFFNIRDGKLNAHVFMRSSDVWLGVPYDVFNFSMIAHLICCRLGGGVYEPGSLHLTAASRHLYLRDMDKARECLAAGCVRHAGRAAPTPPAIFRDEDWLMETLSDIRAGIKEAKWWLP